MRLRDRRGKDPHRSQLGSITLKVIASVAKSTLVLAPNKLLAVQLCDDQLDLGHYFK